MRMELGLAHFWAQSDMLTQAVAILLVLLSVASWYVMAAKAYGVWQARRCHARALAAFWGAPSLPAAIEAIRQEDRTGVLASLAIAGANAAELHRQHSDRGIGAGVSVSEFVTRSLRSQIVEAHFGDLLVGGDAFGDGHIRGRVSRVGTRRSGRAVSRRHYARRSAVEGGQIRRGPHGAGTRKSPRRQNHTAWN